MMACAIVANPHVAAPPYGPPVAEFSSSGDDVIPYTLVSFTDLTTGTPTSWEWKVNGSIFSTAPNSKYYFITPGYYDIKLTASNMYGSSSRTRQVFVESGA